MNSRPVFSVYRIAVLIVSVSFISSLQAQNTFSRVYDILQTNCAGASCHSAQSTDKPLLIDTSRSVVYNNIVGATPSNEIAKEKGYKLVDPGYPARSFLLRKIAHGISTDLELEQGEGDDMPKDKNKLDDVEIEIVRQWIMYGAPETGEVVDEQLITRYYNGEGTPKIDPLPAPKPGEGIQLHEGPYFIDAGGEQEFFHRVPLNLPTEVEVYELEMHMHDYSHHMILYKYMPGKDQNLKNGVRVVGSLVDQYDINVNANFIATWQYDRDIVLPPGTAYIWDENTVVDANYHIPNYNDTAIIAAELYLNIYYRPRQPETVEMFAGLAPYGATANDFTGLFDLNILNNSKDTTFVMDQHYEGFNETWYFWVMQAHTHKHGKDYDIWLRNEDGSKGEQVYEGFYNQAYEYNEGYYEWEHPAVRTFWPLLPVDMSKGLIHEATYYNDGPKPVHFGLTTDDEMFITYYQYTKQQPVVGIEEKEHGTAFTIYPNPYQNEFYLDYTLKQPDHVIVEMYDLLGTKVSTLIDGQSEAGNHRERFNTNQLDIAPGVYLIKLTAGENSVTKRIVQMN